MSGRELPSARRIAHDIERVLPQRIMPDWTLRADATGSASPRRVEMVARVTSPAGETADGCRGGRRAALTGD